MTAEAKASALGEWKRGWALVLTCTFGMSLSTIGLYSMGLFFAPLEAEFGWSRAQVSFGLTIYAIVTVPLAPFAGAMIDRLGARRIAIPGIIAFGAAISALSLAGPEPWSWWLVWVFIGLAVLLIKSTVWVTAISSRFEAARGLALAIALSGTAIASFFAPILARWLIDENGWRMAYVLMGSGWAGMCFILAVLFFYDARDCQRVEGKRGQGTQTGAPVLPGKTFREAIRDSAFLKVCLASFMVQLIVVGSTVHFLPMLTLRGLDRETAAFVVSLVGLMAAVGKLGSGWLFDRFDPRPIAGISLMLPGLPLLILALVPQGDVIALSLALATAVVLGLATGAELSATAYLASAYVGLRSLGTNYGIIASIMSFAAGVGPLVAGLVFDATGGYGPLLYAGVPAGLIAGSLMWTLPGLPDREH